MAAAVIGIIAATFVQLARATGKQVTQPAIAIALFAIALTAAWRLKGAWVIPVLVASGAVAAWLVAFGAHPAVS